MKVIHRFLVLLLMLGSAQTGRMLAASGWFWQNPWPQGNPLYRVFVLNADTVVAVGALGTVIKTTDAGTTWAVQHTISGIRDTF